MRAVCFRGVEFLVVVGLERFVAHRARSFDDLRDGLVSVLAGYDELAGELGIDHFNKLPRADSRYFDMWDNGVDLAPWPLLGCAVDGASHVSVRWADSHGDRKPRGVAGPEAEASA